MGRRVGWCCVAYIAPALLAGALALQAAGQERFQPPAGSQPAEAGGSRRDAPAPAGAAGPQLRPPGADAGAAKRGLLLSTAGACAGYTLFAPLNSTTTYLVDLEGKLVHSWPSKHTPGQAVYLLADGSVLRAARQPGNRHFGGGGIGGRVERIALDGKLVWEFVYADENHCQHHDIKPLANGHVLLVAWEKKTREQALAAGRDPKQITRSELWPDCLIEVEPEGTAGGKIVWEWHVWDHLVQEVDASKPNYGVVAEHSELVDLNYRRTAPRETPAEVQRLRSLGYVGGAAPEEAEEEVAGPPRFGPGPGGPGMQADWCHTNSLDYNAKLDQIVLSVHTFNEIWIIDHSTSTQAAAGHVGGRYGKGGDLLYRWGNPRAYGAGGAKDQQLFAQHDVRWIPEGLPGGGHLTVFNNGPGRPGGPYSSVIEIAPPIGADGCYRLERGKAFEPSKPCWEYTAAKKRDFFSSHISGAERLPNGNTLICSGEQARVFEVSAEGKTVWEYVNPYIERNGPDGGFGPPPGGWRGPRRMRDGRPGEGGREGPPAGGEAGDRQPAEAGATTRPQAGDSAGRVGNDDPDAAKRSGNENERPEGRGRPWGPPGNGPDGPPGDARWGPPGEGPDGPPEDGRWGPPGGGPGRPPGGGPWGPPGGGPGGGLFRATRLGPDHPGVRRVLDAHGVK